MRKRRAHRLLVASGAGRPFEPSDEQRWLVSVLAFNGTPEPRIASGLGLTLPELQYYFRDELGYAGDRILAHCAADMIKLARQKEDLGVSLRANELMLRTRLPNWREPKQTEAQAPALERVESLSLREVEAELAKLK